MAQGHRYIAGLTICLLLWAQGALARPVLWQVEGGDTAFLVDTEAREAFWVQDDCKRPLPVEPSANSAMQTDEIVDSVELGGRQMELRQRFRFEATPIASVEIYNSVRGGWTPVPVQVEATCHQSAECRARMELPPCTGG